MNRTKICLLVTLTILHISCKQSNTSSTPSPSPTVFDTIPNVTIQPTVNYISGPGNRWENFISVNPSLLPQNTINLFSGKIRKSEMINNGFILDTLVFINDSAFVFFNKIYGFTQTNFFIFNYIIPEQENDTVIKYAFSGDTVIIPFRFHVDSEGTILTRWKTSESDTFEFIDYFKTSFATKYSSVEILELTNSKGKQFLVGKTNGGEGGDFGETLWYARILRDNRLEINYLTSIEWDTNSDTIPTIHYNKMKDGISAYKVSYQRDNQTGSPSKKLSSKILLGSYSFEDN